MEKTFYFYSQIHRVWLYTWCGERLLGRKHTCAVRALPLSLPPSDEKLINEMTFLPICSLQEVSHILLNLFSFLNG